MIHDDLLDQELFTAGQCAPPGEYRRIDSGMIICLDKEDYLPASLDGKVAAYMQVQTHRRMTGAGKTLEMNLTPSRG